MKIGLGRPEGSLSISHKTLNSKIISPDGFVDAHLWGGQRGRPEIGLTLSGMSLETFDPSHAPVRQVHLG